MTRLLAASLLALVLGAGCSAHSAPRSAEATSTEAKSAEPSGSRHIMVTFALRPEIMWKRAVEELAGNYELEVIYRWPLASLEQQCVVFELPEKRSAEEIASRVSTDPRVRLAQPIYRFQVLGNTSLDQQPSGYNDPHSHLQHGLAATRVKEAHRQASGRGVKIAVIDTGIDVAHPDLEGRVVKAQSFVQGEQAFTTDVHGTAVAGVIAAGANNAQGIVGMAPGAELFALKACWQDPPDSRSAVCDSYTLAQAVDFAITEGAQVVNFSLTGPHDPLLSVLIESAVQRNIAVLAAADESPSGGFPASHPDVLAVRGTPPEAREPSASADSRLSAPSVDILSTAPSNSYDFFSGSSLAVAQVSGLAALLLEKRPDLSPAELAAHLRWLASDEAAYAKLHAWRDREFSPTFQALIERIRKPTFVRLAEAVRRAQRGAAVEA